MGLLIGKVRPFLTELSARNTCVFYFKYLFNGFSPNLICAFILWRSALGLLIGKFRQFLTVICPRHDNCGVLSFHVLFLIEVGKYNNLKRNFKKQYIREREKKKKETDRTR